MQYYLLLKRCRVRRRSLVILLFVVIVVVGVLAQASVAWMDYCHGCLYVCRGRERGENHNEIFLLDLLLTVPHHHATDIVHLAAQAVLIVGVVVPLRRLGIGRFNVGIE